MSLSFRVLLAAVFTLSAAGSVALPQPNPNSINYTLPSAGRVSVNVYDAQGRICAELLHGQHQGAGTATRSSGTVPTRLAKR